MEPFETIETADHKICCDGGKGALGHPAVYLEMGLEHKVTCPYCSRMFVQTLKKAKH